MKINKSFSRKFLIAASAYRKQVKERDLDFSFNALKEQYEFETYGKPVKNIKTNGYNVGQWVLGVSLSAMKDDYQHGLFTKNELMKTSCYYIRQQIKKWESLKPFWYQ